MVSAATPLLGSHTSEMATRTLNKRHAIALALLGAAALAAVLILGPARGSAPPERRLSVSPVAGRGGMYEARFEAMGTDGRIVVAADAPQAARPALEAAVRAVRAVERLMSTYRADSEVSRLNRLGAREKVALSEETAEVLRRAQEVSRLTDGAFDVTYAPLRALWRRAAREGAPPHEEALRDVLAAVGWRKLRLDGGEASFTVESMAVDLGGIAKGYGIDRAAGALQTAGVRTALVDLGGDMRLLGAPAPGEGWRVQVRRPPGAAEELVLELTSCAVATSGDYARGFRVGDEWFSHIVDPRTGWPAETASSVTVVAPDATTADALATALSVMEPAEGLALVGRTAGVECLLFVRSDDGSPTMRTSEGMNGLLTR